MKALLLIDIQNDFCAGGAIEIAGGNDIVSVANEAMAYFELVAATKEWHPANHQSFAANHLWRKPGQVIALNGTEQTLYPMYCIMDSFGSNFVGGLATKKINAVFHKGTDASIDSYSGFYDSDGKRATGLEAWLKEQNVTELYILGLGTDYCIKYTVFDAIFLGFSTYLIVDGCRGVNLEPLDSEHAIEEMLTAGVQLINSKDLL